MKLSILFPVVAVLISESIALPAPIPLSRFPTDGEKEAADPSPPRPFPADRVVEWKDPSPPRPFPKYPLVDGNPLEERVPVALSRFPTDGEDEASDPSPPRPFPAGRIVESPPLEQRDPSAPHKVVEVITALDDPSLPTSSPEYSQDGDDSLEKRDPLSRFPNGGDKEAADPSPPRPFLPDRLIAANDSSANITIEPRIPSPLLRTTEGSEAEANDPSPPRPFPAGHLVQANVSSSNVTVNDPSPPRPFPAGHLEGIEPPRAEEFPPHRGHGGYFPPSNPPTTEATASATEGDVENNDLSARRCPVMVLCGGHPHTTLHDDNFSIDLHPSTSTTASASISSSTSTATSNSSATATATAATASIQGRFIVPPLVPLAPLPTRETLTKHHPNHRVPIATAFAPHPTSTTTSTSTSFTTRSPTSSTSSTMSTRTITKSSTITRSSTTSSTTTTTTTTKTRPTCTTTLTSYSYHHLGLTGASTVHAATTTVSHLVNCHGCALAVTTVGVGNGPQVPKSRAIVTEQGTETVHVPVCSASSSATTKRLL